MRIGFDAKRAFNNATGLGNYSRFVLNALQQYAPQHHYTAYLPRLEGDLFQFPNVETSKLPRIFQAWWRSHGMEVNLRRNNIQLYHGLSNEIPTALAASNIRSVVTIHDLIFLRYPQLYQPIDRRIYLKKSARACHFSDCIVAVSEQTKRDIIQAFGTNPEKIKVVYQDANPVFQQRVSDGQSQAIKAKYQLQKPYVLTVGSLEVRKNQARLISAFQAANLPDAELIIVGGASKYQATLEAQIKQSSVRILNNVPSDDLPALYQNARVFAYPSVFEGFGIPIVEALHSRVPVLAANNSCLQEAGGSGAIYANPFKIDDLTEKLREIWTNETLQKELVENGTQHVKQFAAPHIAQQLVEIYDRCMMLNV